MPIGSLRHLLPSQDLCRMVRVISFRLKAALFSTYRIGTDARAISSLKFWILIGNSGNQGDRKLSRDRRVATQGNRNCQFVLCALSFVLRALCLVVALRMGKKYQAPSSKLKVPSSKLPRLDAFHNHRYALPAAYTSCCQSVSATASV
jgi:hypothetical protein